jgi:AraC-like DNA-binding protein
MKSTNNSANRLFFFKSKWFWFVNILFFVSFLSVYFLFFNKEDFVLFPHNDSVFVFFYADDADNGNSFVENSFSTDSIIYFEFILGQSHRYPYAGVELKLNNGGINVAAYNRIQIDFASENLGHMWLFANVKDRNIKDTSRHFIRRTSADIHIESKRQTSVIRMDDFTSPDWWYNQVNQQKKEFGKPEWKELFAIEVNSGLNIIPEQVCKFTIFQIKFIRDNALVISIMVLFQCCILVGSGFFIFVRSRKSQKKAPLLEIVYKPVDNMPIPEQNMESFMIYIHENFANPDLSLTIIAKQTGISPRTISDTFSEKYKINLKNYINQIRIHEAKRLLQETELHINQIAYQVGYNSPANFNRVFKKITGKSPTDFLQDTDK